MENNYVGAPTQESEVFGTISRISKKLETLSARLSPITQPIPKNVTESSGGSTRLTNELRQLDNKLGDILDSIVL